jgi:hypothetical protein
MNLLLDDLTIKTTHINMAELCEPWIWLLINIREVIIISKMGDMFLAGDDGSIYWLATDIGALSKVANNRKEFEQLLKDEDNIDHWFLPSMVEKLIGNGKVLGKDQVYSFKKIPVIGGDYSLDNIEPTDLNVHFALSGQICEQIKDLPDGTPVKIKIGD